jgi:hypothetical protein
MMNGYHHSQVYTPLPSHHSDTTTITDLQTVSLNENYVYNSLPPSYYSHEYQPSFYDSSISQTPYDNSIQSYDQYNIYPQLIQQTNQDFSLSNQIIEQTSSDEKPILNEAKYKWMQIKRTPAKTSGIKLIVFILVRKCIPSDRQMMSKHTQVSNK